MSFICFTLACAAEPSVAESETRLGNKVQQSSQVVDLYIPEFSRPTGKYVSRLLLRIFNASLRKGSLVFIGNPCTPGMSVMNEEQECEAGNVLQSRRIKTVVGNFWGKPQTSAGIVFQAEPFMLLELNEKWKNLEDYKQAMHSKYRVRVNKALNCSSHLHIAWKSGHELSETAIDEMAGLLAATLARKTLALPPDLRGLIKGFCKEYGDRYQTVFLHNEQGTCVGFLSCVVSAKQVFAMHIGYRVEFAREWHLYQRLMLELIGRYIETGMHKLQLGRTATEIKSTLGAVPLENSIVVYTKSILLRQILHFYKRYCFKPKSYTLRQPFH
jgi:hypothetical protein